MNVVVTSGPTREPVDAVRFVSNVSSGRLGVAVAGAFLAAGHRVTFLSGQGSARPETHRDLELLEFDSAASLLLLLERTIAATHPDALIHAAAVADFAPVPVAGKIPSNAPELVLRLRPTVKIADKIRARFPELSMVMFKLEAEISREELHARARATLERVRAQAIVANLVEDVTPDSHRADLLTPDGGVIVLRDRAAIARALITTVERFAGVRPARTGGST